ncbi:lasso peptide biosynthesis B2 protein [Alkalihalobacillus pseudalcaliphilus]|uniref:lasso peptide biosynthesis B2 protein n=1 Tax=Alkalihalobacillus pseudalcaliphilus TaxID=79884 RepID=UPI00064D77E6|nr:lasso peptide biosynthesis B2 protein [Alkalihalobacillus pseudalcaliphilus]KMK75024.1 stage V sporulation protein S [Alkalihalobacillus pseudalcaliphilus]
MSKLKHFIALERSMKLLLIEAYYYLGWARMKKLIPFQKLVKTMEMRIGETTVHVNVEQKGICRDISWAIHIMSSYTFWESECLVKALAAMKMLERRQIESTLYLATGKDEKGSLVAHAWLRSGSFYISGAEGKDQFTVIAKFSKEISPIA